MCFWRPEARRALALLLSALVALTVGAAPARAQQETRERIVRCSPDAWGQARAASELCDEPETLAEQGWDFDRSSVVTGSVGAGLAAVFGGWAWGGVGHFLLHERPAARKILALQLTGAAAIAGGVLLRHGTDGRASEVPADLLRVGGGSLLAAAWAADVLGGFRGLGSGLSRNTSQPAGLGLEIYYTILLGRGVAEPGVGLVRLPFVTRHLRLRPRVEVDVSVDYHIVGADGALRLPLGTRGTVLEFVFDGEDAWWRDERAGWTRTGAGLSATIDLGDLLPHLRGLRWRTTVGGQVEWPRWGSAGAARFREGPLWTVPLELALHLNLSPSVHLEGGYRHRRDQLVGAISPGLGMFFAQVGVSPRDRFGVELALEYGESVRAFAGLRFNLLTPDTAAAGRR